MSKEDVKKEFNLKLLSLGFKPEDFIENQESENELLEISKNIGAKEFCAGLREINGVFRYGQKIYGRMSFVQELVPESEVVEDSRYAKVEPKLDTSITKPVRLLSLGINPDHFLQTASEQELNEFLAKEGISLSSFMISLGYNEKANYLEYKDFVYGVVSVPSKSVTAPVADCKQEYVDLY